ncbi:hypothetical protein PR003_g14700 [Phytophthora rubi]|uniref:Uncharacterized protein n=1 Tax=Phytophthora rubi TaxID=129364 RepID=A0A6A4EU09_9STRA|nr:hypothetical protein PR003_g14700 [Phytophthora rubi]
MPDALEERSFDAQQEIRRVLQDAIDELATPTQADV